MNVIKRDGSLVPFKEEKIQVAIGKAFIDVDDIQNEEIALQIASDIKKEFENSKRESVTIEEIQDLVEKGLIKYDCADVAKAYIRYRYKRELIRQTNTTDQSIMELIDDKNDYWKYENSNKNSKVVTVQRDYLAGITSTDIARRFLLPKDVVEAHDAGIIHQHDMDYFAQHALTNCELVNLEDMLQNGTVINGVKIDKPHRLLTASTIATQIILAVTSSTYGGCTITLTHLAPFVRSSFYYHYKTGVEIIEGRELDYSFYPDLPIDSDDYKVYSPKAYDYAVKMAKKEVADSVQTFNYQVNSMTNTNG
jgi:ribonucleoside-triphosphate reductase